MRRLAQEYRSDRLAPCACVFSLFLLIAPAASSGQTLFDSSEFQARRKAALEKAPDGIILLRSFSGLKHWDESDFHQDSSFYYFAGLANVHAAILVLDGNQKESWLFVAPRRGSLRSDLHGFDSVFLDPGPPSEAELKIDHVVLWVTSSRSAARFGSIGM
jgi:Aminopeptidase P, N-terminal domain